LLSGEGASRTDQERRRKDTVCRGMERKLKTGETSREKAAEEEGREKTGKKRLHDALTENSSPSKTEKQLVPLSRFREDHLRIQ